MSSLNRCYQLLKGNGYLTVRLVGNCENNFLKDFEDELQANLIEPYPYFVVNCESLSFLSNEWVRGLIKLQLKLLECDRDMRFILVKPALLNSFKTAGIDTTFKRCSGLREALSEMGLENKKMLNTDFINPFLTATLRVLSVQAQTEAKAGQIFVKKPDEQIYGDVSGIIGIVSDSFNGSVVISFPKATFLKIMSQMLGETYTEINKDILDGAGEITNMVFGQAKIVLNEKGYGIKTALPSVISGKDHTLSALTKGPVVVIPFESTAGNFMIEVCLSD